MTTRKQHLKASKTAKNKVKSDTKVKSYKNKTIISHHKQSTAKSKSNKPQLPVANIIVNTNTKDRKDRLSKGCEQSIHEMDNIYNSKNKDFSSTSYNSNKKPDFLIYPQDRAVKIDQSKIAYKKHKYLISLPVIDKITLCSDFPNSTVDDKNCIIDKLDQLVLNNNDREFMAGLGYADIWIENPEFEKGNFLRRSYHRTYRISFKGYSSVPIYMSLRNPESTAKSNARYCRIEMNPAKLTKKNVRRFIEFFDGEMHDDPFEHIIDTPYAINNIHLAIDIFNIEPRDMILNDNERSGSMRYYKCSGSLETYYHTHKKSCPFVVYNKTAEVNGVADDDDFKFNKGEKNKKPKKDHPAGNDLYLKDVEIYKHVRVVRLEIRKKTKKPLSELAEIKNHTLGTYVKAVDLSPLSAKHFNTRTRDLTELLLANIQQNGRREGLKSITDRKLRNKLEKALNMNTYDLIQNYKPRQAWVEYMEACLKNSGFFPDDYRY